MKESLPLLEYTESLFKDLDLSKTLVIACQHILGTNLIMFEKLFKHGLKPENTFLLGKCYSTNNKTLLKFKRKGVFVHSGSTFYDSHLSFDEQFNIQVFDFLNSIKNKVDFNQFKKIILIDDGGYLLFYANSIFKDFKNIVAVEQTSSGYIKIKEIGLNFPVINVARSYAKLNHESPFVAETIIKRLNEKLLQNDLSIKKVLVIGAGPVGKSIYNILKKDHDTELFDIKESSLNINSILGKFDMIIGCSGNTSIKKENFSYLKNGVVLVSASSSDREFSSFELKKLVKKEKDCHKDLKMNGIYLLNSGFPINFDGEEHSAIKEKIQFTRSLMFAAICLANSIDYPLSILELDKSIQEKVIKEFKKINILS